MATTPPTASPRPSSPGSGDATRSPIEPTELVFTVAGDERRVRVFVPDPMPAGKRPLVLFLHAAGETPAIAIRDTRLEQLTITDGAIVAFPPADGRAWGAQVTPGLSDSETDEAFLRGLIDQLINIYPVDPDRVYVAGFSMGAVMAGRLACRLADRIAAAAVVSGTPWIGDCMPSRPVSVLIVHGSGDSTFRHAAAESMAQAWRERDDCPPPSNPEAIGDGATRIGSDGCAGGTAVQFVSVENGWHTWFRKPDASALAWRFFVEHGRR